MPGEYITYNKTADLAQLTNELRNSVAFLEIILSEISRIEKMNNEDELEEDASGEDEDDDVPTLNPKFT